MVGIKRDSLHFCISIVGLIVDEFGDLAMNTNLFPLLKIDLVDVDMFVLFVAHIDSKRIRWYLVIKELLAYKYLGEKDYTEKEIMN